MKNQMNRRQFVKSAAAAIVAPAVLSAVPAESPDPGPFARLIEALEVLLRERTEASRAGATA